MAAMYAKRASLCAINVRYRLTAISKPKRLNLERLMA